MWAENQSYTGWQVLSKVERAARGERDRRVRRISLRLQNPRGNHAAPAALLRNLPA
jgi:hypothetical protein